MTAVQPEHNQLADLIAAHEQRLGILRIQAARKGDDTPPEITAEIARITDELAHLKQATSYPISPTLMEELGPAGRSQLWMSHIMRLDADIGRLARDLRDLSAHIDDRFDALRVHIDQRLDLILLAMASVSQPAIRPARPPQPLQRRAKAGR
jgi:hypothetical protein